MIPFATLNFFLQLVVTSCNSFFISQLARRVDLQPLWLHNETMNKETWFKETVQGDTIAEVALKAGIIKTTAWRQYNNALGFSAENVILIARAYHKSPVEALVEFGYIRADEMTSGETVARLHDASNDELLQERGRRLGEQSDHLPRRVRHGRERRSERETRSRNTGRLTTVMNMAAVFTRDAAA